MSNHSLDPKILLKISGLKGVVQEVSPMFQNEAVTPITLMGS